MCINIVYDAVSFQEGRWPCFLLLDSLECVHSVTELGLHMAANLPGMTLLYMCELENHLFVVLLFIV